VIVAGFGRFGQIAGRLLLSSGVKMVILDHDPDHVDTLRKFDMKVSTAMPPGSICWSRPAPKGGSTDQCH
jgi:voltage-gated potassium channel Kch